MKIGFICDKHSNRDIIAEALALKFSKELGLKLEIYSASISPDDSINPITIQILEEKGINTSNLKNKSMEEIPYEELDILVVICDKSDSVCPYVISHTRRETWIVEEPEPPTLEGLKQTQDKLEKLIKTFFKYDKVVP